MKNGHNCVFVLGMHRSGTSFLSGCLHVLGVDFGDSLMQANADNLMGYWEHPDVFALHEHLFQELSSSWAFTGALPQDWRIGQAGRRAYGRIRSLIERNFAESPIFAVKDPRLCRFLPLWLEVMRDMDIAVHPVVIVRDPIEVALSLATVHQLPLQRARLLWLIHYRDLLSCLGEKSYALLSYEQLLDNPIAALDGIVGKLDLTLPYSVQDKQRTLLRFAQPELRRHRREAPGLSDADRQAFVSYQWIYRRLLAMTDAPAPYGALPPGTYEDALAFCPETSMACLALNDVPGDRGASSMANVLKELFDVIGEYERREETLEAKRLRALLRDQSQEPLRLAWFCAPDAAGRYDDAAVRKIPLLRGEWQEIRFDYTQSGGSTASPLRIFPFSGPGEVRIASVRVVNAATQEDVLRLETPEDFERCPRTDALLSLPTAKGAHFVCLAPDQHFLIGPCGEAAEQPLSVRVWLRIEPALTVVAAAWRQQQEQTDQLRVDRDSLADRLESVTAEKAATERALAQLRAQADPLRAVVAKNKALRQLTVLSADLDRLGGENKALETKLAAVQADRDAALADQAKTGRQLEDLRGNLECLAEEKRAAETALAEALAERADLQEQLERLYDEKSQVEIERDATAARLAHALTAEAPTFARLKRESLAARRAAHALRLRAHSLDVRLERREEALQEVRQANETLVADVADLRRHHAAGQVALTTTNNTLEVISVALKMSSQVSDALLINTSGLFQVPTEAENPQTWRPSPYHRACHPLFDEDWYLECNPDVRQAGLDPLAHYLRYGALEARNPHPLFDVAWYLDHYPDVAANGHNPLVHYWIIGGREGRSPHPFFDGAWYLERNPDVAEAGRNPLSHYMECGAREGRNPHPLFDDAFYRAHCPTGQYVGNNALLHYLAEGILSDCRPGANFDVQAYRTHYSDLLGGMPPFLHYCRLGQALGLNPLPANAPPPRLEPFSPPPPTTLPAALIAAPESHRRGNHDIGDTSPLRLAWVVNDHDRQTMRYRAYNYAAHLGQLPEVSTYIARIDDLDVETLATYNILILCRIADVGVITPVIDRFHAEGKLVIYDIDDLVFDPYRSHHIDFIDKLSGRKRLELEAMFQSNRDVMLRCDLVTVSTHALKREVQALGLTAHVLPNTISDADAAVLSQPEREPHQRLRLAYFSGTATHERDFAQCSRPLLDFLLDHPEAELLVVGELACDEAFEALGDRLLRLPLLPHAAMLREYARVDVNLAPLEPDNPFTNAKSELKVYEAALYGVPTVASPVSGYASCIRHGANGLLAATPGEWRQALDFLADNRGLCEIMGETARQTIPRRFLMETAAGQAMTLYRAVRCGRLRRHAQLDPALPRPSFTIISILYNKANEVEYFLESLRRQNYQGDYEVLLINDCSPDDSVGVVQRFEHWRLPLPDSNPGMRLRIVSTAENSGNCVCRNLGQEAADGDILVIVDADCMFNEDYLSVHAAAYAYDDCDAAIGPMDIETGERDPFAVLNRYEVDFRLADPEAGYQDPINPDSFVNCVTRNFSIRRDFARRHLGGVLFDEVFTYSAKPDSGFGWEDVELGCRLFEAGARLVYLPRAVSLHVSHPCKTHEKDKGLRSLRNFRRLHEKHPDLVLQSRQWSVRTYTFILDWVRGQTGTLETNEDYRFLEAHFKPHLPFLRLPGKERRLRVLTYRWHCPYQFQLMRLPHDFTLCVDGGTDLCQTWELQKRPLPACAVTLPWDRVDPRDYDVALLPFDENFQHPELGRGEVPLDWGRTFMRAIAEWDIPKIGICHGTPQFYGQYNAEYDKANLMQVIEENRQEARRCLGDMPVVFCTHQQREEWDVPGGRTIWHGFASHEYPRGSHDKGVLSMTRVALLNRPWYNGLFINDAVRDLLGDDIPFEHLLVPAPISPPYNNAWAVSLYQNYAREVGRYSIYFNPTIRSPMPWSRTEAMLTGLVSVSLRNYDVDLFIQNGVDGFFGDTPEELADQLRFLMRHPAERARMADASRRTAWRLFNQDRWLDDWTRMLRETIR